MSEFDKLAVSPLDEWISYLKTGRIPPEATAPGPPEERLAYDRHMDNIMIQNDVLCASREDGLAEGEAKGLEKGKAEVAINMKKRGLPASVIAQCTDLSIAEIEQL